MATAGTRNVISRHDVEAAQAVLDAWRDGPYALLVAADEPGVAYLRGLITQALADANATGYDAGVIRGRRMIAYTVRDALDGEGL